MTLPRKYRPRCTPSDRPFFTDGIGPRLIGHPARRRRPAAILSESIATTGLRATGVTYTTPSSNVDPVVTPLIQFAS